MTYTNTSVSSRPHPDTFLNLAGDFNHADPKTVFPTLYHHINFVTWGNNMLDNVLTPHRGAYKAFPSLTLVPQVILLLC